MQSANEGRGGGPSHNPTSSPVGPANGEALSLYQHASRTFLRRTLRAGTIAAPILGAVWALALGSWLALSFAAATLVWLALGALVDRGASVKWCGRAGCAALFLLCAVNAWAFGGVHSFAIAWLITVPIAAAVVSSERDAWAWSVAITLVVAGFYWAEQLGSGAAGHPGFEAEATLAMFGFSVVVFATLAALWVRSQRTLESALRQSLAETEAETEHVGLLLGLANAVHRSDSFPAAGRNALTLLGESLGVERAAIWDFARGRAADPVALYPADAPIPATPPAEQPSIDTEAGLTTASYPIRSGAELHGAIQVSARDDAADRLPALLENVSSQLATHWLNDQRNKALSRQALMDDLTELPNRRSFHQVLGHALDRARRARTKAALLYVDLDGFKRVNDTLGHEAGDLLLRHVAKRIQAAIRLSDYACTHRESTLSISRLGGDEFTVLLEEVGSAENAELVACRILDSIARPIELGDRLIEAGASIGVAVYPEDGRAPDELVRAADRSMYAVKRSGGNGVRRVEGGADEVDLVAFNEMLDAAFEGDQLRVHYQPIVSGETARPVAVEALLRWTHPERGELGPGWFIPLAEDAGRIGELGAFAVCEAVRWFEAVHRELDRDFRIAVNVSARQFEDERFTELVRELLDAASFRPDQLELEVTESVLIADAPEVLEQIRALSELGVGFALDDFGTGYSSLSLVKRIPISRIKLDRSFVSGLPDDAEDIAIAYAVLGIADALGVPVVAEGVEDEAQQMFLTIRGCQELQGFLFSKPCAPETLRLVAEMAREPAGARDGGSPAGD